VSDCIIEQVKKSSVPFCVLHQVRGWVAVEPVQASNYKRWDVCWCLPNLLFCMAERQLGICLGHFLPSLVPCSLKGWVLVEGRSYSGVVCTLSFILAPLPCVRKLFFLVILCLILRTAKGCILVRTWAPLQNTNSCITGLMKGKFPEFWLYRSFQLERGSVKLVANHCHGFFGLCCSGSLGTIFSAKTFLW